MKPPLPLSGNSGLLLHFVTSFQFPVVPFYVAKTSAVAARCEGRKDAARMKAKRALFCERAEACARASSGMMRFIGLGADFNFRAGTTPTRCLLRSLLPRRFIAGFETFFADSDFRWRLSLPKPCHPKLAKDL